MPLSIYAATIVTSAFLLFQVQPIIARIFLPWFGGAAAVWTMCLLFFQVGLLLGYLYAHWSVRRLRPGHQALLHLGLLAASVLTLPLTPRAGWKPQGSEDPTLRILLLLLITVGLPYFLLSATGPLLQAWYARRGQHGRPDPDVSNPENKLENNDEELGSANTRALPYQLYALSNAGSMLALLSYPALVEPYFTIRQQSLGWSAVYVVFALLCGAVAWRERGRTHDVFRPQHAAAQSAGAQECEEHESRAVGWRLHLYWLSLAACASTLLLAVTNHLSQNVAAIPFLWVLPLSLYLLSFIICFGGESWRWEKAFLSLPALAIGATAYTLFRGVGHLSLQVLVPIHAGGLFICCVLCHGELARTKPHPRYLTSFYLMLSIGGALGGLFVGVIAPRLFQDYYELPIALAGCALLAWLVLYRDERDGSQPWRSPTWLALGGLIFALVWALGNNIRQTRNGYRLTVRNFYGVLRISEWGEPGSRDARRELTHGTILHGSQFIHPERRSLPTTYYGPKTGVGLALRESRQRALRRVGIIGLGTGTIASYGRKGDSYRFYDINPLVAHLAKTQFSFVRDSRAKVEMVLGDARLSLEREPEQHYDVLVVDAFSSDSIPVHLLTRDAFALYFRHLKKSGVLAVHVSNSYLNLEPVVANIARSLGKQAVTVRTADDDASGVTSAVWALVTARRSFFRSPLLKAGHEPMKTQQGLRTWTDDYSSLYQSLR